jgi:hypothetical protein
MIASKGLGTKVLRLRLQPLYGVSTPARPPRPQTNTMALRVTQPGLPSWWRLAAPDLNWLGTFVNHISWAVLALAPSPLLIAKNIALRADWVATRHRLLTLTRGPMARKKKSRVQFLIPQRPMELRLSAGAQPVLSLSRASLEARLGQVRGEESF